MGGVEQSGNLLHFELSGEIVVNRHNDAGVEFLPAKRHKHAPAGLQHAAHLIRDAVGEIGLKRQGQYYIGTNSHLLCLGGLFLLGVVGRFRFLRGVFGLGGEQFVGS